MAYLIDDQLPHDERFRALRRMPIFADALAALTLIGIHCASERNDGRIFRGHARGLAPSSTRSDEAIAALLAVGFLTEDEAADEYVLVDFLTLNESRAEMLERRRKNAEKQRNFYSRKRATPEPDEPNRLGDRSSDETPNPSSNRPPVPSSGSGSGSGSQYQVDLPSGALPAPPIPKAKPSKGKKSAPKADNGPTLADVARTLEKHLPAMGPINVTTSEPGLKKVRNWARKHGGDLLENVASMARGASRDTRLANDGYPLALMAYKGDELVRKSGTPTTTRGPAPAVKHETFDELVREMGGKDKGYAKAW